MAANFSFFTGLNFVTISEHVACKQKFVLWPMEPPKKRLVEQKSSL